MDNDMVSKERQRFELQLLAVCSQALKLYRRFRPVEANHTAVAAIVIAASARTRKPVGVDQGTGVLTRSDIDFLLERVNERGTHEAFLIGVLLEDAKIIFFEPDDFDA